MATCTTIFRIYMYMYTVQHILGPQILISNFQKNPLVSPHVCTDQRGRSGLSFAPHQVFKATTVSTVPLLTLAEKGTNLSPSERKHSKFGDLATEWSILEVFQIASVIHPPRKPRSEKCSHWKFSTFVYASTQRPDQRLDAIVLTCTYILIRSHGCCHRNDNVETTYELEKNLFLVNFRHPDFVLFSSLCCLGPCAAIATLKQMLANNCYETHERSVFFDLGPRTNSFKHLTLEIPDHGWSFYRQVRAAKSLLMTTVIQKTLFWGKCPTACKSRSPSSSGPTRWKLFLQCHVHVSYFNLNLFKIECACLLPHALPLLLVWPANPANFLQSLGKWSDSVVPEANFLSEGTNC